MKVFHWILGDIAVRVHQRKFILFEKKWNVDLTDLALSGEMLKNRTWKNKLSCITWYDKQVHLNLLYLKKLLPRSDEFFFEVGEHYVLQLLCEFS